MKEHKHLFPAGTRRALKHDDGYTDAQCARDIDEARVLDTCRSDDPRALLGLGCNARMLQQEYDVVRHCVRGLDYGSQEPF
jgi:hypothetical protein